MTNRASAYIFLSLYISHVAITVQWRSQGEGMVQSSHRFRLAASSPKKMSESSLSGGLRSSGFAALTLRRLDLYVSPHSPPAKLDSDKSGDSRRTKPAGLIESCTPGPRPDSVQQGVWGEAPLSLATAPHHAKQVHFFAKSIFEL